MRGINTSEELVERLQALGITTISQALAIPSVRDNPLCVRILARYKEDGNDNIASAIGALCEFLTSKKLRIKLFYIFQIYDQDMDGVISNYELFELLSFLNRGILSRWKIQNIVDKTFAETNVYCQFLDFENFVQIIKKSMKNPLKVFKCDEW